ncbi:MAG: hypothetical protein ACKVOE_06545 [Rickettsiales bacterium]
MHETNTEKPDQKLGDQKLKLAGYAYLLGDGAMYAAAKLRGESLVGNKLGAISWGVGGLAAARYGNPDAEKRLAILGEKLRAHLAQQGVAIPDDVRAQNTLLRHPGLWESCENFLYQHPSEILNAGYALGAATLVKGALPELGKTVSALPFRGKPLSTELWIGITVLIGALSGLFIKEDKEAPARAKGHGFVAETVAAIQEKPLRFSSAFYTLNNVFLAGRAWRDFSGRNTTFASATIKPHVASTLQLATYLFGNAMLMLSSRNQLDTKTQMPHEHLVQLEDAAARIVSAQPAAMQQALLGDLSLYLAAQKGVEQEAPEIAQTLANRLTELTQARAQSAVADVSWAAREKAKSARADMELSEPVRG